MSVTLVTGDKVTVTPAGKNPATITVQAPDGDTAEARITKVGGDTYVYPASAVRYLAAGVLDRRLFNITELITDGYDDAHTGHVPLIVTYEKGLGSTAKGALKQARSLPDEATDIRPLTSVNGAALAEGHKQAAAFWDSLTGTGPNGSEARSPFATASSSDAVSSFTGGVAKVWLDGKVSSQLAETTAQIGAPKVWADGNTGKGVDVAVLDTGYDLSHPDLAGVVASSESFVPGESVDDQHGHGTHVASTIAGSGAASDGKEKGVAPGASLHVGKVLSNGGSGQDSWILAGMEWAARDVKARVVSMSLGSEDPSDGTDLLSQSVNQLSAETGTLFTIAAGNSGPEDHTVRAPGTASAALTVGAVDSHDAIAGFSSRGPRLGDDGLKPEITAPGVGVLAARSHYYWGGEGYYMTLSGTSMATPHVAGAATLLAAEHPDWNGAQLKDALVSTAAPTDSISADDGGNGRVDAAAATGSTLFATGTADAGMHSLGGKPGETVEKPVQWTNTGDEPVTVDVAVDAPGAPAGLFTLSTTQLTVPAHSSASATMTTHLDKAPAAHRYTGRITASVSGTVATRTLIGVSTQQKPYHLRIKLQDRAGHPVDGLVELLRKGAGANAYSLAYSSGGELDTIVLPGTYAAWSFAAVEGVHGKSSLGLALLTQPQIEVTEDIDVVLGGSALHETAAPTPRPSTTDLQGRVDYYRSFGGDETAGSALNVGAVYDSIWAQQTAKVSKGSMTYTARWRKQQPLLSLASGGQSFDDLWLQPGSAKLPEGSSTLPVLFAGSGTKADYASLDAAGKAVVVRYNGDDEQIAAAKDAGVKLLLLVNDRYGRLREPIGRTSLTVAGLSRTEGEKLITRIQGSEVGSVAMKAVSHPVTTYLYDLVHSWRDRIPADQTYAPKAGQLARVEVDFRNDPTHEVQEYRYDVHSYLPYRYGVTAVSNTGTHRTDYVTSDTSFQWMEEVYEVSKVPETWQNSDRLMYPAGRTTEVMWFGPIQRPRVNGSIELPHRTGDKLVAYVPGWGDSGENHVGTFGYGPNSQTTELYRGGDLLATTGGGWIEADLPPAKSAYRLVTSTARTGTYPYSTRTRTEWTFSSASAGSSNEVRQLPLVQLDYRISTAADGSARRDAKLVVTPSHLPGGPGTALRTNSVELSYDDGATWKRAVLSSSAEGALVKLHAPTTARFLTLRVRASDSRGNTVTQTITRAVAIA
ncbi:S8 family serine peptidase [Streptomyces sp. NPDC002577]